MIKTNIIRVAFKIKDKKYDKIKDFNTVADAKNYIKNRNMTYDNIVLLHVLKRIYKNGKVDTTVTELGIANSDTLMYEWRAICTKTTSNTNHPFRRIVLTQSTTYNPIKILHDLYEVFDAVNRLDVRTIKYDGTINEWSNIDIG